MELEKEIYIMNTKKVGEFLKALRKSKGYTQEEVSNALFLSPKTISRWENGNGIPDINIISSVAELYDVTVDEILKGERRTMKTEEKSPQTISLQNKKVEKLLADSCVQKWNHFFFGAMASTAVIIIVSLIVWFTASVLLAQILILLGLLVAIGIMFFAHQELKLKLKSEAENGLEETVARIKVILLYRNIRFSYIIFGLFILWHLVFFIFLNNDVKISMIFLTGFYLLAYLIGLTYYSNHTRTRDLRTTFFTRLLVLSMVFSILFFSFYKITELHFSMNATNGFNPWWFNLFSYLKTAGYIYRGISIGMLVSAIFLLFISYKRKWLGLMFLAYFIGFGGSLVASVDFLENVNRGTMRIETLPSICGIIYTLLVILFGVVVLSEKRHKIET